MAFSLFPKVVRFFDLFRQQNDLLVDSASLLNEIFHHYRDSTEKSSRIVTNEMSGNEVSREIARSLAMTFITPLDREDIHAINTAQETVLNAIRSISTRIGLYRFGYIKPGAKQLAGYLLTMVQETSHMLDAIKARKPVDDAVKQIKTLKVDSDMLLLVSLGEVYESHPAGSADYLDIIKWSHIYDRIEEALANTEVLASILEGVSLKNA